MIKKSSYLFLVIATICLLKLVQIGYKRINFSSEILFNSFTEDFGGNIALSKNIIEGYKLISQNKLPDFNLSKNLISNGYFKQRIVEYSYPIRLNKDSNHLISQFQEKINCKLKSQSENLKLYEC
tara:strand:- start:5988 stop:6362 length:375 start_codon:yes stop_codon:yes gene_type:complete